MKKIFGAGCIFIIGLVAFLLIRNERRSAANVLPIDVTSSTAFPIENQSIKPTQRLQNEPNVPISDLLASAYQTAKFIDQVYDSVPSERATTRIQLKGLQVAFFLSDYVMTSKTNKSLEMTSDAIVSAFTNVSPNTLNIRNRLKTYAERLGTLTDHYQATADNPQVKDQITAIKAAMNDNGLTIDTENDLLMDCIRYAFFHNEIYEMYGPHPKRASPPSHFPEELNALLNASDTVFRYRFEKRFGITSSATSDLMNRLKQVQMYDASDADMQIPARIR